MSTFVCKFCNAEFCSVGSLLKHMEGVHMCNDLPNHRSRDCRSDFMHPHNSGHRKIPGDRFECDFCETIWLKPMDYYYCIKEHDHMLRLFKRAQEWEEKETKRKETKAAEKRKESKELQIDRSKRQWMKFGGVDDDSLAGVSEPHARSQLTVEIENQRSTLI